MMNEMHDTSSKTRPAMLFLGLLVLVCACMLGFGGTVRAQAPQKTRSVLVMYWYGKDFPGNVAFEQSFKDSLKIVPNGDIQYFAEYLEEDRFPGKLQAQILHAYLLQKYANRNIDVVVSVTDRPLKFLLDHQDDLFPHSPIVFLAIKPPPREA